MKSKSNRTFVEIPKEVFENIFFQDGGQKKLEKSLTGSYQYGIDPSKPYVQPNAEVEKGEFIQDSQGVREVVGNKHKDGGVKVRLEDYSKILSDNLQVGEDVVKEVKEVFGVSVSKKDTYAKVLKKIFDKIGLTEIIEEQEKIIAKLKKQQDNTKDAETLSLNTEVLSAKINELEEDKKPKEEEARKVFDYLFQKQEQSKEGIVEDENNFQDGGIYGEAPSPQLSYPLGIVNSQIRDEYIRKQGLVGGSSPRGVYGTEVDKTKATSETSTILPSLWEKHFDKDAITPRDVLSYQSDYNAFSISADSALKDFYGEDSADYLQASSFLSANRFTDDDKDVRFKDNLYGNYTSTRPSVAVKMIPKEELEKLKEEGINTIGQLKARHPDIYSKYNKGVDFPDDVWLAPTETPAKKEEDTKEDVPNTGDSQDRDNLGQVENIPDRMGLFLAPDQTPLPPDSLEAHLKTTRRYERMDYTDISPEQQLAELNKQTERVQNNLDMMPPQQRAAMSANFLATQSDATNKLLQQTQQINQQGRQQIENANAQIQMRENIDNAQDALNYEQRQLMAQARTDADLRNFYNTLQRNNLMNFNTINNLNLSNALYDNFQFTDRGIEAKGSAPSWVVNWWNNSTKNMTKQEQQEFFRKTVENKNN